MIEFTTVSSIHGWVTARAPGGRVAGTSQVSPMAKTMLLESGTDTMQDPPSEKRSRKSWVKISGCHPAVQVSKVRSRFG